MRVFNLLSGINDDLTRLRQDRDYWRNAYETLLAQTGRDLNDGYGRDPRKPAPNTKDQDHG
jgi:hypothetical protein